MNVSELLRKMILVNGAANVSNSPPTTMVVSRVPPKSSMKKKSAVRPRNEVSSKSLQYLAKKNIWNKKSRSAKTIKLVSTPKHVLRRVNIK